MGALLGKYTDIGENDKNAVAFSQVMAANLTILNRKHMRRHLYEATFYVPMIDVMKARNYKVTQEYKIN